ncbi:MAG TPA: MFS transporter [Acidimicrobiales bacterium]|nr:MFS transporter [Acidimicrobiales bacterium]
MTVTDAGATRAAGGGVSSLWNRQLDAYPDTGPRIMYLGITVLATVMLYYELYVGGSVSVQILQNLHISFTFFVWISAIGNLIGAFASLFAGFTDRFGRTNLVVGGLFVTGIMVALVLPACTNQWEFGVASWFVGTVEGICLVATPALIRDFSPQTGRAAAMGFWTCGPVLGSLIVAEVATATIKGTPSPSFWTHEYHICGIAGIAVAIVALFGLKELSPGLRDQLMVSMKDRALIEVRAKGLDIEDSLRNPFRQLLKPDVVISALGVSIMLLIYYTSVGFGVIYLSTVFGESTHNANALGNWQWGANALALISVGILSDKLRVRKPLMVLGGVGAAVFMVVYLEQAGHHPGYYTIALLLAGLSIMLGIAYTPWMASFTETVEAHNPALTATGLAIWGWIIRVVVFVATISIPVVISSVTPLVNYGGTVQTYATQYAKEIAFAQANPQLVAFASKNSATLTWAATHPQQVADATRLAPELQGIAANPGVFTQLAANPTDQTLQAQAVQALGGGAAGVQKLQTIAANQATIVGLEQYSSQLTQLATLQATQPQLLQQAAADGAQLQALGKVPPSVFTYLQAHAPAVIKASKQAPGQWKTWYWVCFGGIIFFLGCVPLMKGRWSPAAAKADEEAHEAMVQAELAKIGA